MSRMAFCTCPSCLGTRVKDLPCEQDLYAEIAKSLMTPSAALPVVIKRSFVAPSDFGASNPVVHAEGYTRPEIDTSYSAQRAAFLELLQKTRQEHDEMQETILFRALGMTAEEAVANRRRISRHCHPDQDVFLVDGEPVVAIHKPVIRGDELVTCYQILRTLP